MKKLVFAIYKPNEGKETELLGIVKRHTTLLLAEKLISDRKVIVLKAAAGQIVEIFEWLSTNAIGEAHENENVLKIWAEFAAVCTHQTLQNLSEVDTVFPDFEVLDI